MDDAADSVDCVESGVEFDTCSLKFNATSSVKSKHTLIGVDGDVVALAGCCPSACTACGSDTQGMERCATVLDDT